MDEASDTEQFIIIYLIAHMSAIRSHNFEDELIIAKEDLGKIKKQYKYGYFCNYLPVTNSVLSYFDDIEMFSKFSYKLTKAMIIVYHILSRRIGLETTMINYYCYKTSSYFIFVTFS
ncbi:LOW QUALITY PROTEIN: hypothetical protein M8C21_028394 [Ambrosia artemisiifolia]|uniref:Uncharacterized protein n=1 Tax=Ambrosia artemisiifolia TaxID=4212 RepID=A0AAD5BU43_AMBAR|nr:LOW QUALITY PROTEIN: hypothetical protein M8C21_028394 [Ambrosia artemisiifolia]